jgi:hypothetical protein
MLDKYPFSKIQAIPHFELLLTLNALFLREAG